MKNLQQWLFQDSTLKDRTFFLNKCLFGMGYKISLFAVRITIQMIRTFGQCILELHSDVLTKSASFKLKLQVKELKDSLKEQYYLHN